MRRFLRENGLSLGFGVAFLLALTGQSWAGLAKHNEEARAHGEQAVSYLRYVVSSDFGVAVLENWQSEYLQFSLYILATIWLVQKGSSESKALHAAGLGSDEEQRVGAHAGPKAPRWARVKDWRSHLYANSLLLVMAAIFFGSWFGQSLTGWRVYNSEQSAHNQLQTSWAAYLGRADFWERSLQNWQSELLAVGSMTAFTIYLRQRSSPESKPVGAPHDETGTSG